MTTVQSLFLKNERFKTNNFAASNTLRTIGPVSTPAYSVCGQIRLVARQSDHYVRTRLKLHKGRNVLEFKVNMINLFSIYQVLTHLHMENCM
jgi:hypothetical protein